MPAALIEPIALAVHLEDVDVGGVYLKFGRDPSLNGNAMAGMSDIKTAMRARLTASSTVTGRSAIDLSLIVSVARTSRLIQF